MNTNNNSNESTMDYKGENCDSNAFTWLHNSRRLTFSPVFDEFYANNSNSAFSPIKMSPPCRNVLTLRLTEQPSTPGSLPLNTGRRIPVLNKLTSRLSAPNLNPFTPESMLKLSKKRLRCTQNSNNSSNIDNYLSNNNNNKAQDSIYTGEADSDVEELPVKRLAIIESNSGLSRFLTEFKQRSILKTGEFGCVYKCTNRMDGCDYVIKKSSKIIPGSDNERKALNEVFAHAVFGKHENIVQYFTAWAEDQHILIQTEFCNGGSLQDAIEKNKLNESYFSENEIRTIISHLAEGLRYIHSHNLVHMNIKPGNIFISYEQRVRPLHYQSDETYEEKDSDVTYKIGNLTHVISTTKISESLQEEDMKYLPKKMFFDDCRNLPKADIYSLGLTIYECAGGELLKKNGTLCYEIHEGKISLLKNYSKELNDLIKQMTHSDLEQRPTAFQILKNSIICTNLNVTKEQLERELQAEKTKTQILEKKLKAVSSLIKSKMIGKGAPYEGVRTRSNSRIIGKKVNRSHSTTEFGW